MLRGIKRALLEQGFIFLLWKRNEKLQLGTGFLVHHRTVPEVKTVEVDCDRIKYIVLRGRWCNIIVLNEHAPSEEKNNYSKDRLNEELEYVFDHFPEYRMEILLGDFNAKLGLDYIFKPTTGNESLRQDSNDNDVRIVNFTHQKI